MPKVLRCLDCSRLTSFGSRCPACSATKEAQRAIQRGTTAARGYITAWRTIVRKAIANAPYCELCGSTVKLTGDHRIALAHGGQSTAENCRVLCLRCNSRLGQAVGQQGRR